MAFVGIATIVGIGEVVVKFDVNAGSKKKLDFVKVMIPFLNILECKQQYKWINDVLWLNGE